MKPFHIALHARPAGHWPEELILLDGRQVSHLVVPSSQLCVPLPVSFEEVSQRLAALPRMFLEPDGSFVWVSDPSAPDRWQIDGVLWDRGGRLQYVELSGNCPVAVFDELVAPLRSDPSTVLVVQLLRQAVWLEEASFRQFQFG